MGFILIIVGRYKHWVEDGRIWKISESVWDIDSVDKRHMRTVMPRTHFPTAGLCLHLELLFAASTMEENRSSDC